MNTIAELGGRCTLYSPDKERQEIGPRKVIAAMMIGMAKYGWERTCSYDVNGKNQYQVPWVFAGLLLLSISRLRRFSSTDR